MAGKATTPVATLLAVPTIIPIVKKHRCIACAIWCYQVLVCLFCSHFPAKCISKQSHVCVCVFLVFFQSIIEIDQPFGPDVCLRTAFMDCDDQKNYFVPVARSESPCKSMKQQKHCLRDICRLVGSVLPVLASMTTGERLYHILQQVISHQNPVPGSNTTLNIHWVPIVLMEVHWVIQKNVRANPKGTRGQWPCCVCWCGGVIGKRFLGETPGCTCTRTGIGWNEFCIALNERSFLAIQR